MLATEQSPEYQACFSQKQRRELSSVSAASTAAAKMTQKKGSSQQKKEKKPHCQKYLASKIAQTNTLNSSNTCMESCSSSRGVNTQFSAPLKSQGDSDDRDGQSMLSRAHRSECHGEDNSGATKTRGTLTGSRDGTENEMKLGILSSHSEFAQEKLDGKLEGKEAFKDFQRHVDYGGAKPIDHDMTKEEKEAPVKDRDDLEEEAEAEADQEEAEAYKEEEEGEKDIDEEEEEEEPCGVGSGNLCCARLLSGVELAKSSVLGYRSRSQSVGGSNGDDCRRSGGGSCDRSGRSGGSESSGSSGRSDWENDLLGCNRKNPPASSSSSFFTLLSSRMAPMSLSLSLKSLTSVASLWSWSDISTTTWLDYVSFFWFGHQQEHLSLTLLSYFSYFSHSSDPDRTGTVGNSFENEAQPREGESNHDQTPFGDQADHLLHHREEVRGAEHAQERESNSEAEAPSKTRSVEEETCSNSEEADATVTDDLLTYLDQWAVVQELVQGGPWKRAWKRTATAATCTSLRAYGRTTHAVSAAFTAASDSASTAAEP